MSYVHPSACIAMLLACGLTRAWAETGPAEDLAGKSYTVTFFSEPKVIKTFTFSATKITCAAIGEEPIGFTASRDAKKKDVEFTAKTADGHGGTLVVSGTVSGKLISGSIEDVAQGVTKKSIAFSGAIGAKPAEKTVKK